MAVNYASFLPPLSPNSFKCTNNITYNVTQLEAKESTAMWTSDVKATTVIRMDCPGIYAKSKPLTVHTLFAEAVQKAPKHVALKYKLSHDEKYLELNYADYYRLCCMVAKSFIQLGLEPRNSVCIAGFNSPPWHLSFIGAIFAAGVASGVYTTNNIDTVLYIVNNCSCQIAVVENNELLLRYLEASTKAPKLQAIIQFKGEIQSDLRTKWKVRLYNWVEFMNLGIDVSDKVLVDRLHSLIPNQCCSLIYTSGTTGNPKGVMMSHDNLIWTSSCAAHHMKFRPLMEEFISYLPLSHVAAQMCDIMIPLCCQATIWFAMPDALKGTLGKSLKEARPTIFLGVPRVWEKIAEQMKEIGITMSGTKKAISAWAKDIGLRTNLAIMHKETTPYGYTMAKIIVYHKVRANLGLDRCVGFFSAAAPLSISMIHYFASLDIVICEIYGMSECSGPHAVGFPEEFRFGTVGKIFPEFDNKLAPVADRSGEGEICMRGRHVFMGYVGDNNKTAEVFDKDNYLHSGDIGKLDADGYLLITGRIKELIITAGGENVAPVPIEDKIKDTIQLLSNAIVIGDQRKFLAVLLTIKCIIDPDTQCATNVLTPAAKRWCKELDYEVDSVSKIISDKNPKVWSFIDDALKTVNKSAVSSAANVQKWIFLPCDFSVGGGELGPTMKVKRGIVTQMYAKLIDNLYET